MATCATFSTFVIIQFATLAQKIISDAEQSENQQLEAHCRGLSFVPVPMIVAVDAA